MLRNGWIVIGLVIAFVLLKGRTVFAVKPGVLLGTQPQMEYARRIIASVWQRAGYTLTITSGLDSVHGATSKHQAGLAEDYRTRDVAPSDLRGMVDTVKAMLGSQYDVVLESDHLHVEYDPQ